VSIREDEMDCIGLVELVTDYIEGVLPERERARFESHLADCDGCAAYLEQMRTTIRLTGALHEHQIPPDGRQELLRLFRAWRAG
jgi:anti-sigma factor RsiW